MLRNRRELRLRLLILPVSSILCLTWTSAWNRLHLTCGLVCRPLKPQEVRMPEMTTSSSMPSRMDIIITVPHLHAINTI
ncbi:hypothetical protein B484DRAFT_445646 [Ochromonadaceae sp. CCMP2298]|nr:hypothetical protein B484DRAFT_445646 [Ochromonadaceae sp. CCMP2298]